MGIKNISPKVFISYSWTSDEHIQWVIELAKKLVSDDIRVILDKWDLKPGDDKYVFIEQITTDPGVTHVLLICDRKYKEKAEQRTGGVGDEALIISGEIYNKVNHKKFIPIVSEYDEYGQPCLPVFAKRLIYIDFSVEADFNVQYKELLRAIFDVELSGNTVIDSEEADRLVGLTADLTKREPVINFLIDCLSKKEDPTERYWIYIALGKIGGQIAGNAVKKGLTEVNDFARLGAEQAEKWL